MQPDLKLVSSITFDIYKREASTGKNSSLRFLKA